MKLTENSTMGQIWREMSPTQQEKLFFFLLRVVEFYGSGDTWFAVSLLPDPPAGLIMGDHHWCEDLNRQAPGGRARIAWQWVKSAFQRRISGHDWHVDITDHPFLTGWKCSKCGKSVAIQDGDKPPVDEPCEKP